MGLGMMNGGVNIGDAVQVRPEKADEVVEFYTEQRSVFLHNGTHRPSRSREMSFVRRFFRKASQPLSQKMAKAATRGDFPLLKFQR